MTHQGMTMRSIAILALAAASCSKPAEPAAADDIDAVMAPIRAFYDAFGKGFRGAPTFATDDWNHINPGGGRTRGPDAVLAEVHEVHSTFLKDVTDTIVSSDVRFADPETAVATVVSRTSPFAAPGDPFAYPHDEIRTFVVVKRDGQWLVMQDHNTNIGGPPSEPPASGKEASK